MRPDIRKIVTYEEETLVEGFRRTDTALVHVWRCRDCPQSLGRAFCRRSQAGNCRLRSGTWSAADRKNAEARGQRRRHRSLWQGRRGVGLDGEIEHASALIHTLRFGNHFREAVGAKSYLAFTNTRGPANAPISIPLMDKNDAGRRSHYLTLQFAMPDAPRADEIVVALWRGNLGPAVSPHRRSLSGSERDGS